MHHSVAARILNPTEDQWADLVESSDSIRISRINDFHVFLSVCLAVLIVLQHQFSLLCVPTGTGSQELCSPIKPNPLPEHRHGKIN